MATIQSELESAARSRQLVRLTRRFETSRARGYVLDVGPKFFLLSVLSDRVWLDGFQCLRVADVSDVTSDPYSAFAEKALALRGEGFPERPNVSVTNVGEMVESAGRAFPLVAIHRESVDPDVCWIGRIERVSRGRVSLVEITPSAEWVAQPTSYKLSEITRLDFGGDYEGALHLVASRSSAG